MKLRYLPAIAVVISILTHELNADDIATSDEIIVTATRSEQSGTVTPTIISVITAADIAMTGARSLTEVLRSGAGLQIKDNIGNGSRASVSMRGFGSNSVNNILITVDGRKLNNPTLEAPLLSAIALKDVERIEILQGSGGVLFGDQAVGGVINIITKRPAQQQFYAQAGIGSDHLRFAQLSSSQKFDNGLAYRWSGENKKADNYRDNNEQDYHHWLGLVSYEGDWGAIFYEYQDIEDELELPGFLTHAEINENRRQSNNPGYFSDQDVTIHRLGLSYHLPQSLFQQWTFDSDYSVRNSDGLVSFGNAARQDTRVAILGARLLGAWETERGRWLSTLGYENIDSDYDSELTSADWRQTQQSFYGQLVAPIFDGATLAIGGRKTDNEDKNLAMDSRSKASEHATEIGLVYHLSDAQQIFIRRAEGFRFANIDENADTLPSVDFLAPQTSTSIEVGYEYHGLNLALKILGYRMDIDDELYYDAAVTNPGSLFGVGANTNLESSNRRGIIVETGYDISSSLHLKSSYSQVDATYKSGSFDGSTIPFVPEQTAMVGLAYLLTPSVSLYIDALYTGRRFAASDEANLSNKLGSYTVYNLHLGYNADPDRQHATWSANVRINNLTGKAYSGFSFASGGYPAPQTTVEMTVGYHF